MQLSIDHVVVTVTDINKSIHFYSVILGMELQEFTSTTDNIKRKSLNLIKHTYTKLCKFLNSAELYTVKKNRGLRNHS